MIYAVYKTVTACYTETIKQDWCEAGDKSGI